MRFYDTLKSRSGRPVDFEKIDTEITVVCQRFNLKLLYIFGSYAFSAADKLSDIDIAYLSTKELSLKKWSALFDRLQDAFEDEAIDLVDLTKAPLTLIHRVLKQGRCLYAKDLSTKIEFESRYENLYLDTAPLRREYDSFLLKRIEDGTFGYRQRKA